MCVHASISVVFWLVPEIIVVSFFYCFGRVPPAVRISFRFYYDSFYYYFIFTRLLGGGGSERQRGCYVSVDAP